MAPNPAIIRAVEQLSYRVTVGDVATQAGYNINLAQQELLALATDVGGHLQVAQSGEIVYLFPQNLRRILLNKFLRLRLQEWGKLLWQVLFYLIRISFGVLLIASMALITIVILVIILVHEVSSDDDNFMPTSGIGTDWLWVFSPNYNERSQERRVENSQTNGQHQEQDGQNSELNFFESVFSFLFGDGNPNADLEERRQKAIAAVIRNHGGVVVAEQIAPYLDDVGFGYAQEYEDYMLPVLTRFNGQPTVSPEGNIVYVFPELQSSASEQQEMSTQSFLEEIPQKFSAASPGAIALSAILGSLNLAGAIYLESLLVKEIIANGSVLPLAPNICLLLLGYGTAFVGIPLGRYFWLKRHNKKVGDRNSQRQQRSLTLADAAVQDKVDYARQFAAQSVIGEGDLVYTTENDLIEQESNAIAKLTAV
jgi:hypothetical protein